MIIRKLISVLLFSVLLFTANAYAAYEVDKDLLYDEESQFLSSKWTFNLEATGSDNGTTDTSKQSVETDVGASVKVEKTRTGYWLNGDIDFKHFNDDDTGTAYEHLTQFEFKNFDYTSTSGLFAFNYAEGGYKYYFSDQSPYFAFGQGLANYYNEIRSPETPTDPDSGLELAVAGGVGYGKIVDLGSYERVLIVQDELLAAGLITQKFSRSIIRELLPLFRKTMDKTDRLIAVKKILVNNGLINDKDLTLDVANDILDMVDSAFEKREYGLEIRAAYLQEVLHRGLNSDKDGYLFIDVKYEKPLSKSHQFTSQFDLFQLVVSDKDDKITDISWLNKITSVFGQYVTTEAGLELTLRNESDVDTGERIYGELEYEITEVITWENTLEYKMNQFGAAGADDTSEYALKSMLTYTIW